MDDKAVFDAKIIAAFEDISELILSTTPFVGDVIALYELIFGKSFFDGEDLSDTERILAGVSVIVGSRRIFEGSDKVTNGIIKDIGVSEKAADYLLEAQKIAIAIEELGWKGSREAVNDISLAVVSLRKTGKLPENYISKSEAEILGWDSRSGNLSQVLPRRQMGGDVFDNKNNSLPNGKYFSADVGYRSGYRGVERIVYTEKGERVFITNDHFKTFFELK